MSTSVDADADAEADADADADADHLWIWAKLLPLELNEAGEWAVVQLRVNQLGHLDVGLGDLDDHDVGEDYDDDHDDMYGAKDKDKEDL